MPWAGGVLTIGGVYADLIANTVNICSDGWPHE